MRPPPPEGTACRGSFSFCTRQGTQSRLWNFDSEENMTTKAVILVGGPGKVTFVVRKLHSEIKSSTASF